MSQSVTLDDYKLSCELLGHSADVRAVATAGSDCILSGSRDKSVKLWKNDGLGLHESLTLRDHTNFISSICFFEDEGWIFTGSNDSTICVYKFGEIHPFTVLKGHTSTVSALAKGFEPGTLISGSWDKTARVYKIDKQTGMATFLVALQGHEAAVWAVVSLKTRKYVTGSADKNIFFWNEKGAKTRVLMGHKDCVRGLIGLDDGSLISCGNDAVIKYWNDDGESVNELHGHANYIYTISLNPAVGSKIVVSGGEDSSIRMWDLTSGQLGNDIVVPAQSVWCVTCMANGDIVTGSSDGIVRVFTKDAGRKASEEVQQIYNSCVAAWITESSKELGGIKHNDLPGPESLLKPGTDGQTKIVRHPDGKILCYKWENNQWDCVGDVIGASGATQKTSGKTLYEGKEYDYVFSVDISENAPPIKLPYNRGQDPWQTAQEFIHKNGLPQAYLDQVANFIIKNSDSSVPVRTASSGFEDPFTGGTRYVPGSAINTNFTAPVTADPFTGASSYTTESSNVLKNKHFPTKEYTTFDICDPSKVLIKLIEFNLQTGDSATSEDVLQAVINLANKDAPLDRLAIKALESLLCWPKDILFPVLDIARLAVRNEQVCAILATEEFLSLIIESLGTSVPNQLMSVRCLANMLRHNFGRNRILPMLPTIVNIIALIKQGSSNLQIAISTFYLNATVAQILQVPDSEQIRILTEGLLEFFKWGVDLEASYRGLQALGNLLTTPEGQISSAQIISTEYVMDKIRELSQQTNIHKVAECANALIAAF